MNKPNTKYQPIDTGSNISVLQSNRSPISCCFPNFLTLNLKLECNIRSLDTPNWIIQTTKEPVFPVVIPTTEREYTA
uniref:Uncharacterized protein n=1 Tax=Megaselia scalaris TaxID=36166 RepID=T1GZ82_MEGSC